MLNATSIGSKGLVQSLTQQRVESQKGENYLRNLNVQPKQHQYRSINFQSTSLGGLGTPDVHLGRTNKFTNDQQQALSDSIRALRAGNISP